MNKVIVTISVDINGKREEYTASSASEANPHRIAHGLITSLSSDVQVATSDARIDWDDKRKAASRPSRPFGL